MHGRICSTSDGMVKLRPEMWEVSGDMVVSPCAPWAVTEFAKEQSLGGGPWPQHKPSLWNGAMHGFETAQRCIMELITLSNMITYVLIVN